MAVYLAHAEGLGFYFIDVTGTPTLAVAFDDLDEALFYAEVSGLDVLSTEIVE